MQQSKPLSPIFIVILDEILVARDMEMIIGDLRPDARIVVARSLEGAETSVPEGTVEAVFFQHGAKRLLASALGRRLTVDRAVIVLVGSDARAVADGVLVLDMPFAPRDVAAVLTGLTRVQKAPGGDAGGHYVGAECASDQPHNQNI